MAESDPESWALRKWVAVLFSDHVVGGWSALTAHTNGAYATGLVIVVALVAASALLYDLRRSRVATSATTPQPPSLNLLRSSSSGAQQYARCGRVVTAAAWRKDGRDVRTPTTMRMSMGTVVKATRHTRMAATQLVQAMTEALQPQTQTQKSHKRTSARCWVSKHSLIIAVVMLPRVIRDHHTAHRNPHNDMPI